jgi:hypothetical protein
MTASCGCPPHDRSRGAKLARSRTGDAQTRSADPTFGYRWGMCTLADVPCRTPCPSRSRRPGSRGSTKGRPSCKPWVKTVEPFWPQAATSRCFGQLDDGGSKFVQVGTPRVQSRFCLHPRGSRPVVTHPVAHFPTGDGSRASGRAGVLSLAGGAPGGCFGRLPRGWTPSVPDHP